MVSDLPTLLADYDARSGVPESSFCQDNQGLGQRKRRKHKFFAQQMRVLLSQRAHNLIQWLKHWIISALAQREQMEETAEKMAAAQTFWEEAEVESSAQREIRLTMRSVQQRGIKRFVRQIFTISGEVLIKRGVVTRLTLIPAYPLRSRFRLAFKVLLKPYGVKVCVSKTE